MKGTKVKKKILFELIEIKMKKNIFSLLLKK